MVERRADQGRFLQVLSMVLVIVSSIGAMIVLIDPVVTFSPVQGTVIKIGGSGFSDQLKGAVVSLILVSGFAAVITYWLGASNTGQKAQDSVNSIAQAAPAVASAAVAAASGAVKTDGDVKVETTGDVNVDKK